MKNYLLIEQRRILKKSLNGKSCFYCREKNAVAYLNKKPACKNCFKLLKGGEK